MCKKMEEHQFLKMVGWMSFLNLQPQLLLYQDFLDYQSRFLMKCSTQLQQCQKIFQHVCLLLFLFKPGEYYTSKSAKAVGLLL